MALSAELPGESFQNVQIAPKNIMFDKNLKSYVWHRNVNVW